MTQGKWNMRKLLLVGWQSFCGNELLWIFFNDSFRYGNGGGVYLDFINSGYDKYKFSCTGLYCCWISWLSFGWERLRGPRVFHLASLYPLSLVKQGSTWDHDILRLLSFKIEMGPLEKWSRGLPVGAQTLLFQGDVWNPIQDENWKPHNEVSADVWIAIGLCRLQRRRRRHSS